MKAAATAALLETIRAVLLLFAACLMCFIKGKSVIIILECNSVYLTVVFAVAFSPSGT